MAEKQKTRTWDAEADAIEGADAAEHEVDVLHPEEVLDDPCGDRVVLPFFGNSEQGLVAAGEQVGAEHLHFGSFADFLADLFRRSGADSAQAEGDVGLLAI